MDDQRISIAIWRRPTEAEASEQVISLGDAQEQSQQAGKHLSVRTNEQGERTSVFTASSEHASLQLACKWLTTRQLEAVALKFLLSPASAPSCNGLSSTSSVDVAGLLLSRCRFLHEYLVLPAPGYGISVSPLSEAFLFSPFNALPFSSGDDAALQQLLFRLFPSPSVVEITRHLAQERTTLFHIEAQYRHLLPDLMRAATTLLYPLRWCHALIPSLPQGFDLESALGSPLPILLGCTTKELEALPAAAVSDVFVADCNTGAVSFGLQRVLFSPPPLPPQSTTVLSPTGGSKAALSSAATPSSRNAAGAGAGGGGGFFGFGKKKAGGQEQGQAAQSAKKDKANKGKGNITGSNASPVAAWPVEIAKRLNLSLEVFAPFSASSWYSSRAALFAEENKREAEWKDRGLPMLEKLAAAAAAASQKSADEEGAWKSPAAAAAAVALEIAPASASTSTNTSTSTSNATTSFSITAPSLPQPNNAAGGGAGGGGGGGGGGQSPYVSSRSSSVHHPTIASPPKPLLCDVKGVRQAFFDAFLTLLGDYDDDDYWRELPPVAAAGDDFLSSSSSNSSSTSASAAARRYLQLDFSIDSFVSAKKKAGLNPFLRDLTKTQAFEAFLSQRCVATAFTDPEVLFFDASAEEKLFGVRSGASHHHRRSDFLRDSSLRATEGLEVLRITLQSSTSSTKNNSSDNSLTSSGNVVGREEGDDDSGLTPYQLLYERALLLPPPQQQQQASASVSSAAAPAIAPVSAAAPFSSTCRSPFAAISPQARAAADALRPQLSPPPLALSPPPPLDSNAVISPARGMALFKSPRESVAAYRRRDAPLVNAAVGNASFSPAAGHDEAATGQKGDARRRGRRGEQEGRDSDADSDDRFDPDAAAPLAPLAPLAAASSSSSYSSSSSPSSPLPELDLAVDSAPLVTQQQQQQQQHAQQSQSQSQSPSMMLPLASPAGITLRRRKEGVVVAAAAVGIDIDSDNGAPDDQPTRRSRRRTIMSKRESAVFLLHTTKQRLSEGQPGRKGGRGMGTAPLSPPSAAKPAVVVVVAPASLSSSSNSSDNGNKKRSRAEFEAATAPERKETDENVAPTGTGIAALPPKSARKVWAKVDASLASPVLLHGPSASKRKRLLAVEAGAPLPTTEARPTEHAQQPAQPSMVVRLMSLKDFVAPPTAAAAADLPPTLPSTLEEAHTVILELRQENQRLREKLEGLEKR